MRRRPDLRSRVPHFILGAAVVAVGFFLLRATWRRAEEIIIRQYSEDWRPWNRGRAVRVRPDIDRMRAHHLSKNDLMSALQESGSGPRWRLDPPPGVVFVTRLYGLHQCENLILTANNEGDIVRLKDVAKVEVDR